MFKDSAQRVQTGLNLDMSPELIGENEYTYALNACLSQNESTLYIQNYKGSDLCIELPLGYSYVGGKLIPSNKIVIFLTNPSDKLEGKNSSEIGIIDVNTCEYTQIVRSYCFNFQPEYQIQCEYKEKYNCGRIIYFVDNYNPDRYLNIDDLPMLDGEFDCDGTMMSPKYDYPVITYEQINSFGALLTGAYQFSIQYADKDGIGLTDFTDLTNPIPIIREQSGYNVSGEKPNIPTTKSIQLSFSNIDKSFQYMNLAVLKTIDGVKTTEIFSTTSTDTTGVIYTGTEPGTIPITLDELILRNTIYLNSKTICHSKGQLIRGNLKGRKEDNFQPYANKIQVQWVTYKINYDKYRKTFKEEISTAIRKSLMRDEVYAIGIRLLYPQGNKSCVYHIPARAKNKKSNGQPFTGGTDQYGNTVDPTQWDSYYITTQNDDHFEFLEDPTNSESLVKWKNYNTATIEGFTQEYQDFITGGGSASDYEGCYEYGETSYWESSVVYTGEADVWGDLLGTPIRHHKMPDCSITNLFFNTDGTYNEDPDIHLLGLKFANINIPADKFPDVVGYEILIGDRTFQRTILDKGLLFNNLYHNPPNSTNEPEEAVTPFPFYYTNHVFNDIDDNPLNYSVTDEVQFDNFTGYSPNALFKKVNIGSASELKLEREFYGTAKKLSLIEPLDLTNIENGLLFVKEARVEKALYNQHVATVYGSIRRRIEGIEYLLNDSSQSTEFGVFNNKGRESAIVFKTTAEIDANTQADDSHSFHVANEEFDVSSYYFSLKSNIINLYGEIGNIAYLSPGGSFYDKDTTSINCFFNGDTFITKLGIHKRVINPQTFGATSFEYVLNEDIASDDLGASVDIRYGICHFFVESDINTEFRYNGDTIKEYFSPSLNKATVDDQHWISLRNMWINVDNYYYYNSDYSLLNNSNAICSIGSSFDPNNCTPHYFSRVIYSEKDIVEGLEDNWLIFKPLSFFDFRKDKGQLWDIRRLAEDRVFFRFEDGIYINRTTQDLDTNEETFSLKTAEMFNPEPVELSSKDEGYVGTNSQFAYNSTEFGDFMVDEKRSKIFIYQQGIEELSSPKYKLSNYLRDNLKLRLPEYFPDINKDSAISRDGIGYLSTWDNIHNLWILTKKDYIPKSNKLSNISYVSGIFYDTSLGKSTIIHLDNEDYFDNISLTLSFSPITKSWISWYNFKPNGYITLPFGYYLMDNIKKVIHSFPSTKYSTYFDTEYPFAFEFVLKGKDPLYKANSVNWKTNAYSSTGHEIKSLTFDQGYFYNEEQNTGLLEFVQRNELDMSQKFLYPKLLTDRIQILLSKYQQYWGISYLWDRIKDRDSSENMFKSDSTFDKVINSQEIDYQKDPLQLKPLKGTWIKGRLISNQNDSRITTNLVISGTRDSE